VSSDGELQVKSIERVRDLGEVFTPAATVQAMLALLPEEVWQPHPSRTFLEPACGHGNFVVAVLDRKLSAIGSQAIEGGLPAGTDSAALAFHVLAAVASIYAIDISTDNVIGGTPGHELGARTRMLGHLGRWWSRQTGRPLTERRTVAQAAAWIIDRNVLVANMLAIGADGRSTGRDALPLIDYEWDPATRSVRLSSTTLGAVTDEAAVDTTAAPTLFTPPAPVLVWEGSAERIFEAPVAAPTPAAGRAANGKPRNDHD
jgi:hypothetical protein